MFEEESQLLFHPHRFHYSCKPNISFYYSCRYCNDGFLFYSEDDPRLLFWKNGFGFHSILKMMYRTVARAVKKMRLEKRISQYNYYFEV